MEKHKLTSGVVQVVRKYIIAPTAPCNAECTCKISLLSNARVVSSCDM